VDRPVESGFDLSVAKASAVEAARRWGIELGPRFELSNVSYVAPAGRDAVVKVAWEGDQESLHEAEALELWDGNGAVRLLRRSRRVLLIERANPGSDISELDDDKATATGIEVASRLWRPAIRPFRPVGPEVHHWLDRAEQEGSELVPLARDLITKIGLRADWLVHGDFHHHNILRHGARFVAIDPKPYLSDREYDVPPFLWNPLGNRLEDRARTERRIAAFVAAGLDDFLIRAWTVIRGAYLRPDSGFAERIRTLLD
jgi:streptomycin 6-kinase